MKILVLILSIIIMSSCGSSTDSDPTPTPSEFKKVNINLNTPSFTNDTDNNENVSKEIELYLFTQGILTKHSENFSLSDEYSLSVEIDPKERSKMFFLIDPTKMSDLDDLVLNETTEEDFLKSITKKRVVGEEVKPFFIGINDFTTNSGTTVSVEMVRGVARLDISVQKYPKPVTIESIELIDIHLISYLHTQQDTVLYPVHNVGSFEKHFQPALSSSSNKGVCYLLEQRSCNSVLEIRATVDGKENILRAQMPSEIKRNMIYDVEVEVGTILKATIKERDWEDGASSDADQDATFKSKIDPALSIIPPSIRLSSTQDTLYIPSGGETTFGIVLSTLAGAEVSVDGKGVSIAPSNSGNDHSYDITVTSKTEGAPTSFVYLNVQNPNLPNYYGDRIVLILQGYEIPIYDEARLDKRLWKEYKLPGDQTDPHPDYTYWTFDNMWDNSLDGNDMFHTHRTVPSWPLFFTIDLGLKSKFSRFTLWQRESHSYNTNNVSLFEIYGSNDPNIDGSWESWSKIDIFTVIKPSGAPLGTLTAEDKAQVKAGHTFGISPQTASYRYLRFKVLETWGGQESVAIAELTFWGKSEDAVD